jgi:hypothetical protein
MKSTTIDFPQVALKFFVNSDPDLMQTIETDNGIVFNPQDAGKMFNNSMSVFKMFGSLDSLKQSYEWN